MFTSDVFYPAANTLWPRGAESEGGRSTLEPTVIKDVCLGRKLPDRNYTIGHALFSSP